MKSGNPHSVEEVLEQLGIKVTSVGQFEIAAHCPFHADSHPSFSMNKKSQLFICYQCQESGNLSMLIQKVGGKDVDPVSMLREIRHKSVGKKSKTVETVGEVDPFILMARYEAFTRPPDWAIEERLLEPEAADEYGIKWDRGWIIPIWSPTLELWGWQFKRLDYMSNYPKAVKKSRTLFGLRELEGSVVVLVESPLDVVRLASVGVPAVATYGAYVSRAQIRLLVETADQVLMALDNDEAGNEQTKKLYPQLARLVRTTRVDLPAKDPGDMTDKQVMKVFS